MGLSTYGVNKYVPAGCLFVVFPKESEKEHLKNSSAPAIETVYFKKNPNRLLAIVSTTDNVSYLTKLTEKTQH